MSRSEEKESIMKYKLIYTGLILFVYILGRCIPLYGIDVPAYSHATINAEEMLMQSIGGDMYRYSVFAIGMSPFMISNILVQIAMACRDSAAKARISPGKINKISVGLTLVIATLQAFVRVSQLRFRGTGDLSLLMRTTVTVQMVTGVMVILWLSERNAKYGIGGRTMLIVVNLLDGILSTISGRSLRNLMIPLTISAAVMFVVLVMENAEKRIPVQRISIHNIYADKNYLAIKLNPIGIMPIMFTSAVFMLPQLLISLLAYLFPENVSVIWWLENMTLDRPFGILVYVICEYLLTIGFAMIMINPGDITEQLLKSGDSIVNLHAGRDTGRYLCRTVLSISFFSATVMGVCIVVPLILQNQGSADSVLAMLPVSVMMLTSFWCTIFRELASIHKYDSCQPLF